MVTIIFIDQYCMSGLRLTESSDVPKILQNYQKI